MSKKYNKSFGIFIALMFIITTVIMLINNYTPVSKKELSAAAVSHIAAVDEELTRIQNEAEQYGKILSRLAEDIYDLKNIEAEIKVMEQTLKKNNSLITEAVYKLGTKEELQESGLWKEAGWQPDDSDGFLYVEPIAANDRYVGNMELFISYAGIQSRMEIVRGGESWDYAVLSSAAQAERFQTENRGRVCIQEELASGLIYVEIYESIKSNQYSNEMILLISLFAIAAMWMIQRNPKTGKTLFDRVSANVMKNYENDMSSIKRQGNKATIALNIGMAIAIFADVIYSIALRRDITVLITYIVFSLFSMGTVVLYKYTKAGITERLATIIIIFGFICPMAEHISSGGFMAGRAGDGFLWFLICIYFGLFILGTTKGRYFFMVYVVFLYLDVVLETVLFRENDYEGNYFFAASFILLGFALYIAMEIYVSGAAGHYNRTEELIVELKHNQKLLMQKEKMSALGQLISGVSYEINTPIGAIKASAETMDSLFLPVIEEVLDAAEQFTKEEYEVFQKIVAMTLSSMGEMKNTGTVRKAKKEAAEYFVATGLTDGRKIANLLGQLELVDLNWIKENRRLLEMDGICRILERVTKLTAFTSGIPTTIYSADLVAKIVLALKSYVYLGEGGEQPEFDLIQSIETVLVLYHNQLKGSIRVVRKYEHQTDRIAGNPSEFAQVWTNLIQNAIQAMKSGGVLTIGVNDDDKNMVRVTIEDNGVGIEQELLPRIFEPFFSTDISREGSGLGLNIAKKIIEKYGGRLLVESHPGEGSKFMVCLKKSEVAAE